jgi:hypothetical protein
VSLKKYVRGCVSLKKYKSEGKAVERTVNSKEENLTLSYLCIQLPFRGSHMADTEFYSDREGGYSAGLLHPMSYSIVFLMMKIPQKN